MRGAPPDRIRAMHLADQRADIISDWRSPRTALRGTPAPVPGEQAPMPGDDGCGWYDVYRSPPTAPDPCEEDPKQSVGMIETEALASGLLLQNRELMTQGENLRF